MFNINDYPFDKEHNYLEIGGEAMIFHCHHYITNLQRTILDAEYIESSKFLIGSAADSLYYQLSNLCKGLSLDESKKMAQDIYKCFGYGLIDLSSMDESGCTLTTTKSFFSKTWEMKFGRSKKPVDYYTSGFLAAAYAVIYNKKLEDIQAMQTTCMACGDETNTHIIKLGQRNFDIYPPPNNPYASKMYQNYKSIGSMNKPSPMPFWGPMLRWWAMRLVLFLPLVSIWYAIKAIMSIDCSLNLCIK